MPPPSPASVQSDDTSYTLLVGGAPLSDDFELISFEIVMGLNRIPTGRFELVDGSPADADFPLAASSTLAPGVMLTAQLGYEGNVQTVFEGMVTRQTIRQNANGPPSLFVEVRDLTVLMTITRRNAIYTSTTDSAVMGQIIGNYSGLTAAVTSTSPQLNEITQFYSTDWDFLVSRAEANGMVVYVASGTVNVMPPNPGASPVLSLTYGTDVIDFRLDQDAETQWSAVQCQSWDYTSQQVVNATAQISNANALGTPSTQLAQVTSPAQVLFQSSAPWTSDSLTAWANGLILRSELAKTGGELRFQGSGLVTPGCTVLLQGFGARFNGTAFVSGVTHELDQGRWTTNIEIGLAETPFTERVAVTGPLAGGLLPAVGGLQNAVVTQINSDPANQLRVQVQIPVIGSSVTLWARLAMPYATSGAGIEFFPEVGDEVILGFVNNDPNSPVVLGGLYSSNRAAPFTPDANNTIKAIQTKAGLLIKFDDQNKVLTLQTPAGNTVIFSDQDKSVTLRDQNSNSVKMSSSGIDLNAQGKITLTASQGVSVTATSGDIQLNASTGQVSANAMNVSLTATAELKASGNTQASLQSGVMVQIQGALVKIN